MLTSEGENPRVLTGVLPLEQELLGSCSALRHVSPSWKPQESQFKGPVHHKPGVRQAEVGQNVIKKTW